MQARTRSKPSLRALAALGTTLLALAAPLEATWSIVAVDMRTGEVAVGSATCLKGVDLELLVPVVRVGRGAGAAQASVDPNAIDRMVMFDGFLRGKSSGVIQDEIELFGAGNFQARQFGIVSLVGDPVTFSGRNTSAWVGGVSGRSGTLKYAIQGNVLTGMPVVIEAERAFLNTPGDLSQRLMAAMEAARAYGGDGRCSCQGGNPTACGSPPPSFAKSSHTAFVIVARLGDVDGLCDPSVGCSSGAYYLNLNRRTGLQQEDPIFRLQSAYAAWRANLAGRPDHLLSRLGASATSVPADGTSQVEFVVELVDVEGVPLGTGGAQVEVDTESGSEASLFPGPVTDRGDGTYAFTVTAGTRPGRERLVVTADDGVVRATLHPYPVLEVVPPPDLHLGLTSLSASAGGALPFVIHVPAHARRPYVLLASGSGTAPGTSWGGLSVPLNPDALLLSALASAGGPTLPGSVGLLDDAGRAEARFVAPPGLLLHLVGRRLDWAALLLGPQPAVTSTIGCDVLP